MSETLDLPSNSHVRNIICGILWIAYVCVAISTSHGSEFRRVNGKLCTMEIPTTMQLNEKAEGLDTWHEEYRSKDLSITLDAETPRVPAEVQVGWNRITSAWVGERKVDWTKRLYSQEAATIFGTIYPRSKEFRYLLFIGVPYSNMERGFVVHIRFKRLEQLDEVERILKGVRVSANGAANEVARSRRK